MDDKKKKIIIITVASVAFVAVFGTILAVALSIQKAPSDQGLADNTQIQQTNPNALKNDSLNPAQSQNAPQTPTSTPAVSTPATGTQQNLPSAPKSNSMSDANTTISAQPSPSSTSQVSEKAPDNGTSPFTDDTMFGGGLDPKNLKMFTTYWITSELLSNTWDGGAFENNTLTVEGETYTITDTVDASKNGIVLKTDKGLVSAQKTDSSTIEIKTDKGAYQLTNPQAKSCVVDKDTSSLYNAKPSDWFKVLSGIERMKSEVSDATFITIRDIDASGKADIQFGTQDFDKMFAHFDGNSFEFYSNASIG